MKPILLIALLTLLTFTGNTEKNSLNCALTADKQVYKAGELPKFKVGITNLGKEDIYLIGSLDASAVKWRYPYCYFSIERPTPDNTKTPRCGNINPLRAADFKLIKPGQRFDPYQSIDNYGFFQDHTLLDPETFKEPGTYRIRFYYSTNSEKIADFIGDKHLQNNQSDSLQISVYLKKVPRVELASNEIVIRVVN